MLQNAPKLKGKRVLVLGLGISGQSAVQFLLKRKVAVVGVDRNPELAKSNEKVAALCHQGMVFAHESRIQDLTEFDFIVVSPGVPSIHPLYSQAIEQGIEVVGEIELACREITQKCLAVTGTNGKTTVTLLTTHVLQSAGIKAKALGNVGIPLTAAVDAAADDKTDVFVIELSSFQLETLSQRFIDAGVLLNITPDHLDRYSSMEEYALAKIEMEKNLKDGGKFFVEAKCLKDFQKLFKNYHCYSYGYSSSDYLYTDLQDVYCEGKKVFSLPEGYCGKRTHDVENMIAAYALCSTQSISPEVFLKGFASFRKPSHRIEFVKTINGVHFYDDSKGTNIDAVVRAVEGMNGNVVLIAGGVDKGFPYTSWINAFGDKVKAVCAIGQSKEKIKKDLGQYIPVTLFTSFEEAIGHAASLAKTGENVLLSPGCSSFDMFKDYAHRGQEFQRIIHALKEN